MIRFLKKQPPGRLIALGFAAVILIGSALLMLPISIRPGVEVAYIDALFTSTSAVCVTGLIAVDAYDNFTVFGQAVLAGLIQIGGRKISSIPLEELHQGDPQLLGQGLQQLQVREALAGITYLKILVSFNQFCR